LNIVSTIPNNNSSVVAFNSVITVTFDSIIDPTSLDGGSITVSYIDPNVGMVDSGKVPTNTGRFATDNFINEESSVFVGGAISIVDDVNLVFTPNSLLSPLTKYDVYISDTITDTDDVQLGTIYHMSFTTLREDLGSDEIPAITELNTVIGTNVIYNNIDYVPVVNTSFYVLNTYPNQDSFLISSAAKITFNKDIAESVTITDFVTVYSADLLSDYPESEVQDASIAYAGSIITVTLNYENNKIYTIKIDKSLQSIDAETLDVDFELSYLSVMTPYYVSSKLVRLAAGTLLSKHSDLHIASLIQYYSNDIDYLLRFYTMDSKMSNFIKQKYVLMYTLEGLLLNNMNSGLHDSVSKKLADFSLSITSKNKVDLYNSLMGGIKEWKRKYEITMASMGSGGFVRNKQRFVSDIGRLWPRGTNAPAINASYYPSDGMLNSLVYNGIMREVDV